LARGHFSAHYSLIKWQLQRVLVPDDVPYYWLQRIGPPIIFGCKHAILLQMAMLPLTMSRFSIACLSDTIINRFIPMERAQCVHIIVGYTMGALTILANLLFFVYYGILCSGDVPGFCNRLTGEIMVTGYAISALVIAMLLTSYNRHRIRYEVFYVMHQLVFVLYALTVLHTIDKLHRTSVKDRYQTFQWLVGSFAFYVCDRLAMRLNHKYSVRLVSSSTVRASDGSRMVILKLRRPVLFDFKPGQYAFVRVNEIDSTFHPFTIASGPLSKYLEFYIEVFGDGTWTDKLWHMLRDDEGEPLEKLYIAADVMGPYGTSIAKLDEHSHAVAVGSGTGKSI
jgi:predicted ferric reductase